MKHLSRALALLLLTSGPTLAQTGFTGTWQAASGGATFTVVLRQDGHRLTGLAQGCLSPAVEISEGRVEAETARFTCSSIDANRVITFVARSSGDAITLTWDLKVRDGVAGPRLHALFGDSAPKQFTARRIPDGDLARRFDGPPDQIRGSEFAAAVHLREKDVKVEGAVFIPEKVLRVRGVVVVISWGIGQGFYWEPPVRKLAETTDCALLLARITNIRAFSYGPVNSDARRGGAEALIMLLRKLSEESTHPELAAAPLLLWGHSAAGGFVTTFAALHPQRTIAFVRYHSGGNNDPDTTIIQIPGLILKGGKDTANVGDSEVWWQRGRSLGAPWTFSLDPDATHGDEEFLKKAHQLVIPWIAGVLRLRVPETGTRLRALSHDSAWLGNNRTGEMASINGFSGERLEASWLPDEPSARGWRTVLGVPRGQPQAHVSHNIKGRAP